MSNYSGEPKRPKSHQIGDIAKNQLMELFSSQGWIVDPVISDYGDDLHIQLTERNNLIPVRLYAQIKGTNNIQKFENKNSYKIPNLKRTSIIHWLNSDEITVLILWDIKTKSGFYDFIDDIFHNFDPDKEKNKSVTATLSNVLSKQSIRSFKIMAISNSCDRRYKTLVGMESLIRHQKDAEDTYGIQKNVVKSQMIDTVLFYLTSIGVLKIDKKKNAFALSKQFHEIFCLTFAQLLVGRKIVKKLTEKNIDKLFESTVILSLLKWRQNKFNQATQSSILEGCWRIIPIYYKNTIEECRQILIQNNKTKNI